ncbi:ABC transporter ATP-binding protein [Paracoccus sp. p3-h83]|uniref:ABC transporter ATP-binding protein n=1 Tax=Paracoccus sp. p3-h83 TaxID=3342805 RepID=UPI0035B7CD73
MSLISLRDLALTIDDKPILRDVDIDIPAGQIFGLVGESGSGKSMTALAIMGLLPHGAQASGQIMMADQNLLTLPEDALCALRGARIGMIFQEPMTALNPLMTIGDQVAETLRIHTGMPRDQALAVARDKLDRVGLPAPRFGLDLYPHQLSGGQRQRVAIALAIALRPALLIADEPTTALDVTTQAGVLDLLESLVDQDGMACLLITHDLAVIADRAEQVAVMQAGQVVETGPTRDVFTRQTHPYTRALFVAATHVPPAPRLPPPEAAPILEVREALRIYPGPRRGLFAAPGPGLRAVDGVSLTIARGESLGLVGESGCGKSTLSRAILGLDALQGGTILLDGEPVQAGRRMPRHLRAKVQAVFQDPYGSFNPRWRVDQLLAEPFHLTGRPRDARDRLAQALTEVGLSPDDMHRFIHQFSGGQRQRLAIARALIIRPELIVLDEAVSALDVRVRAQVLDLLAGLRESHSLSYLFISHDLNVVRAITDRVLVMQAGRIVEDGPTDRVLTDPRDPYTRRLIEAAPVIPPDWQPA